MFIMYFTEQPMSAYPEEEARKNAGLNVLTFSNRHFDPAAGSELYQERLEEYKLVDEVGFDGIMLNEQRTRWRARPAATSGTRRTRAPRSRVGRRSWRG